MSLSFDQFLRQLTDILGKLGQEACGSRKSRSLALNGPNVWSNLAWATSKTNRNGFTI